MTRKLQESNECRAFLAEKTKVCSVQKDRKTGKTQGKSVVN